MLESSGTPHGHTTIDIHNTTVPLQSSEPPEPPLKKTKLAHELPARDDGSVERTRREQEDFRAQQPGVTASRQQLVSPMAGAPEVTRASPSSLMPDLPYTTGVAGVARRSGWCWPEGCERGATARGNAGAATYSTAATTAEATSADL